MLDSKKIGRRVTFKYCGLGFIGVCLIPIFAVIYLFYFEDNPVSIRSLTTDAKNNALFLIIQIGIAIGAVYFWGGKAGESIIKFNRSPFWISLTSLLGVWMSLLVGSALTAGVENSFEYGIKGFKSALTAWMVSGFMIFLILGGVHGLISSIWMGKEIDRKGNMTPQQGVS